MEWVLVEQNPGDGGSLVTGRPLPAPWMMRTALEQWNPTGVGAGPTSEWCWYWEARRRSTIYQNL